MQPVLNWILAHQIILASAIVAVIDLAMALNPKLEGNGLLHQVYVWLKALIAPKQQ